MNKLSFYYIDIMVKKNSYFNSTTIILLGLLLLLLAFAIPLFVNDNKVNNMSKQLDVIEQFYSKKLNKNKKSREKFENKPDSNYKLEFYSMDGCHHCNKFKTTWGKIKVHPELGKYAIEIGPESPDYDKLCRTHSIRGFPHIQLTKNGVKISEYKGLRNLEDIYKWVRNNIV